MRILNIIRNIIIFEGLYRNVFIIQFQKRMYSFPKKIYKKKR